MIGAEPGLQDGVGALMGIQGGGQLSKAAKYASEVVQAPTEVGMVGAEPGLQDGLGALVGIDRLASEVAIPELPDPSLAWEDLSAEDRHTLTDLLRQDHHRSTSSQDRQAGRRHNTIRAIPPIPRSQARP